MKITLLYGIIAALFLSSAASAQLNLQLNISTAQQQYTADDTVNIIYTITNREVSFTAEEVALWVDTKAENFTERIGDIPAGKSKSGEFSLGKMPPGGYLFDAFLTYSWFGIEEKTIKRSLAINVEGEKYIPTFFYANIDIETPASIEAGKPFSATITVETNVDGATAKYYVGATSKNKGLKTGTNTITDTFTLGTSDRGRLTVEVYSGNTLIASASKDLAPMNTTFYRELSVVELKQASPNVTLTQGSKADFISDIGCFVKGGCKGDINPPEVDDMKVELQGTNVIKVSATADDSTNGNSKITECSARVAGEWMKMSAADRSFDSPIESIYLETVVSTEVNVNVEISCLDEFGNSGYKAIKTSSKDLCKYECCSNTDCSPLQYCNTDLHVCIGQSGCISVIKNGDSSDKADVVFVGDGYTNNENLRGDVLKLLDYDSPSDYQGLFSVEPFKSNKNKFNIWMITAGNGIKYAWDDRLGGNKPTRGDIERYAAECTSADYVIAISKSSYRSYCYFGSPCACSVGGSIDTCNPLEKLVNRCDNDGRLVLHEFGHGFGWLGDEYEEPRLGDHPRAPNCAPDKQTAMAWWGDLTSSYDYVGYFNGCSYTGDNIRSTSNSIMRNHRYIGDDFGPVNEQGLMEELQKFK